MVIYAGFTASIDKCVRVCNEEGWKIIKADGRGWTNTLGVETDIEALKKFQYKGNTDKIAFIGHPETAGMSLTLTASPVVIFYSNDFKAENRMQAEDRIHRESMDLNLGATIIDIIHLPTDELVLKNLKEKTKLQNLTLGVISDYIEQGEYDGTDS